MAELLSLCCLPLIAQGSRIRESSETRAPRHLTKQTTVQPKQLTHNTTTMPPQTFTPGTAPFQPATTPIQHPSFHLPLIGQFRPLHLDSARRSNRLTVVLFPRPAPDGFQPAARPSFSSKDSTPSAPFIQPAARHCLQPAAGLNRPLVVSLRPPPCYLQISLSQPLTFLSPPRAETEERRAEWTLRGSSAGFWRHSSVKYLSEAVLDHV
mmetsp:Transcript_11665/g.32481  ORF Transcript_11665/g.32481 Transcript_11665/m.32481 type:complete len:209 (-) Transcript_11665:252-878(-)